MSAGIDRATAQWYVDTGLVRLLAQLEELVAAQRRRWVDDLAGFEAAEEPRGPAERYEGEPEVITQGFVVLHVIEELFQHLGHVDLTVDLLTRR